MGLWDKNLKDAEKIYEKDKEFVLKLLMALEKYADETLPKAEYLIRTSFFEYKKCLKKTLYAIQTGQKVDNKSPQELIKELRTFHLDRIRRSTKNIEDFFNAK